MPGAGTDFHYRGCDDVATANIEAWQMVLPGVISSFCAFAFIAVQRNKLMSKKVGKDIGRPKLDELAAPWRKILSQVKERVEAARP